VALKAPWDSKRVDSFALIPTALKTIPAANVVRSCPKPASAQYDDLF